MLVNERTYTNLRRTIATLAVAAALGGAIGIYDPQSELLNAAGILGILSVILWFWTPTIRAIDPNQTHDEPTSVVILVHGTFARRAEWVRDGSKLRMAIQRAVGHPIVFVPFVWTGRNTAVARYRAAVELRSLIERLLRKYPQASHHVIAHSHGGNVVMYALRDLSHPEKIHGVVCLSTPFLQMQPRALGPMGQLHLLGMLTAPFFAILIWGAYIVLSWKLTRFSLWFTAAGTFIFGSFFLLEVAPFLLKTWVAKCKRLAVDAAIRPGPYPVLLLRATGDEATMALASSQMAAAVLNHLWVTITRWSGSFLESQETRLKLEEGGQRHDLVIGVFALALVCIVGTLVLVPVVFGSVLLWIAGLGHGPLGFLLEISSETTPVGEWTVHHLPSNSTWPEAENPFRAVASPALVHSLAYERDDALDLIAAWFRTSNCVNKPVETLSAVGEMEAFAQLRYPTADFAT